MDQHGSLEHRGHVVALSLMCALDAIASYGYRGDHIAKFIATHFPDEYRTYSDDIYRLYRNSLVHSWNLFESTIYPGDQQIRKVGDVVSFGLLTFFEALVEALNDFLEALEKDAHLQSNTLNRYKKLKMSAKP